MARKPLADPKGRRRALDEAASPRWSPLAAWPKLGSILADDFRLEYRPPTFHAVIGAAVAGWAWAQTGAEAVFPEAVRGGDIAAMPEAFYGKCLGAFAGPGVESCRLGLRLRIETDV